MNWIRKIKEIDLPIVFAMLCLIAIGTVAVYRATSGTVLDGLHLNNLGLFGAFCIPMLLAALFNFRLLTGKISYVLYALGVGLLILVHFVGENLNGSYRWLSIGPFQFQPSELAKLFTIMLVAHVLHKRDGELLRFWKDIVPIGIIFAIPFALVYKQPDLGTSLVFLGIFFVMLWMGNIRITYMLLFLGLAAVLVGSIMWLYYSDYELLTRFVKPHQIARIQTFLDPASDRDKSWHVLNAMTAIGSGGLSGGPGLLSERGFIPYVYSDSIFVIIGEKYGFLGAAVLLLLYFYLIYRMILIAIASKQLAGSYLVIGIVGMFIFQIFVNIGMHIGLLPLTGISLPFISYGGSSLLINMVAVGLVLNVKVHNKAEDL